MRTFLLTAAACGLLIPSAARADDATKDQLVVKEIDIKGIKLEPNRGQPAAPKVITTEEQLANVFGDKETREKILKDVDLKRHKLCYFAWAGSGQDKMDAVIVEEDGKKSVVFTYKPGRTKDLRTHFRLFALGKDIPFRMGK